MPSLLKNVFTCLNLAYFHEIAEAFLFTIRYRLGSHLDKGQFLRVNLIGNLKRSRMNSSPETVSSHPTIL